MLSLDSKILSGCMLATAIACKLWSGLAVYCELSKSITSK